MLQSARRRLSFALTAVVALGAIACQKEAPSEPVGLADAEIAFASAPIDLGACPQLVIAEKANRTARIFAKGVQIYRWNGTAWAFVAPSADLYQDAAFTVRIGMHYAGPTWTLKQGNTVTGAVIDRCNVPGGNIPWLLLQATPSSEQGLLGGVDRIHRVETVGGIAPSEAGAVIGEERHVPYTAIYDFWRLR